MRIVHTLRFAIMCLVGTGVLSLITWLTRGDPDYDTLLYGGPEREEDDE